MRTVIEEVTGFVLAGFLLLGTAMIDASDPVVLGVATAVLGTLTGAVKVLWDRNSALTKQTDVALAACKEEHTKAAEKYENDRKLANERTNVLIDKVIKLSGEVGTLTGRIQGFNEAIQKADADARAHHDQSA